ncbi:hypothetical protein BDY21DRAFT_339237 [Lineolata rhizophorae]|uniref:Sister chromatid cohesion protein n=1 Tax=Lineolata rhizophorae TaxID=578093 RepID=A0A6A6P553_9PEZI|nr:hypothetical protein BDY21DRAFT_339237 [Lineolata rhizophorae]
MNGNDASWINGGAPSWSSTADTIWSNGNSSGHTRAPTVDEALPYSPLTSIIPFNPDVVPFPSAVPPMTTTVFSNNEDRRVGQRALDSLNKEAGHGGSTSAKLQKTLHDLQSLLHSEPLTRYKFKSPPMNTSTQPPSDSGAPRPVTHLTPFAKMVYQSTNIPYEHSHTAPTAPTTKPKQKKHSSPDVKRQSSHTGHKQSLTPVVEIVARQPSHGSSHISSQARPSPSTPGSGSKPGGHIPSRVSVEISLPAKQSDHTPTHKQSPNAAAYAQNSAVAVHSQDMTAQRPQVGPSVVIHPLPQSSQRSEYTAYPDIDAQINSGQLALSKKRKREDVEDDARALALSIDQKEKADAAVQHLNSVISEVFEAEDNLQPDTSGIISTDSARYFLTSSIGDSEVPMLNSSAQARLDSAIQRVISSSRFGDISVEHLSRLQKLCESGVLSVEANSLLLGDGWSDSDVEEWAGRLGAASNGLQAAKLLLRIMTAGREEKQLYSEDVVQAVMNALKHVIESSMIPVVEARQSEANKEAFAFFSAQKKALGSLFHAAGKVLRLLGDLLLKVDVSESAITTVEAISTQLIFVENAPIEKESVLGIQKFEMIRRIAMDVVAKIFAQYPDQRSFIFDEILMSLEKLPITRQSARQYRMVDGKPIQLVSALLMRLVQTSGTRSIKDHMGKTSTASKANQRADDDSEEDEFDDEAYMARKRTETIDLREVSVLGHDGVLQELNSVLNPLHDSASHSAMYLVRYMVQRALTSSKTGDLPFRHLLDIFTEDFLSVLGATDWPAAELLLRKLLTHMIGLAENDKSTAPARTMALDVMGLIGSGICDLQAHARNALKTIDSNESELSAELVRLGEELLEDEKLNEADLLGFDGPCRVLLEYLSARDINDPQLQSASGYLVMQWAKNVSGMLESDQDHSLPDDLGLQLRNMLLDPKWLENEYDFENVSTSQGRLAATLVALGLPFSRGLSKIFSILLNSMTSDHATVKSRSLKSVVQLLEKDPSILDRSSYILNHILRCAGDQSPLVRDSALSLIGRCISLKPHIQDVVYERIIVRTADTAVGVRKRAMKILKDIYLRNDSADVKAAIADALLQGVRDNDESVSDLARQTIEEVWMSPFYGSHSNKDDSVHSKLALKSQVSLIIKTAHRGEAVLSVLDLLLQNILARSSKNAVPNFNVCKSMVAVMFDGIINSDDLPDKPSQRPILETLTVFAKANPKLFTGDQLVHLQPYIENLSNTDDLLIYRSVIVIFRHVLPSLSSFQNTFLKEVQNALFTTVQKLGKAELIEVAQCLWIIDSVLKNTERLVRLTVSVIQGMHRIKDTDFADESQKAALARVKRYAMIAGAFGKACDFDEHIKDFKTAFPWWKGSQVASLIVDMLCPLTRPRNPSQLRELALENISIVSQSWPKQYLRADVTNAFELVFHDRDTKMEHIVLSGFKDFFAAEETRSETGADIAVGEGAITGSLRLNKSLVANDNDGVTTCIAQGFLPHIVRIALATTDDLALTATHVIASINRQGLVHPKESGPALVALETSPNPMIAGIAFQEHRILHHKHESMFEKEYMKAVYQAFLYQKDVIHSPEGATTHPFTAKLKPLFEVLKTGNGKIRKKFLSNLVSRVNFELPKLVTSGEGLPVQLLFSRFVAENLAFFDYARVDEILHLVATIEKVVTETGATVAHAIEQDILRLRLDQDTAAAPNSQLQSQQQETPTVMSDVMQTDQAVQAQPTPQSAPQAPPQASMDPKRLRHLTIASMILHMLWETRTYLRRLWCLQKPQQQRDSGTAGNKAKGGTSIKDLNKAPTRAPGVTGDKYWERIAEIMRALGDSFSGPSGTDDAANGAADEGDFVPELPHVPMLAQCNAFVELLSVDNELKVADDDDEDEEAALARAAAGYETPSGDEDERGAPGSGGAKGRKRKGSVGLGGGTPKKSRTAGGKSSKGRGRPRKSAGRESASGEEDGGWD